MVVRKREESKTGAAVLVVARARGRGPSSGVSFLSLLSEDLFQRGACGGRGGGKRGAGEAARGRRT